MCVDLASAPVRFIVVLASDPVAAAADLVLFFLGSGFSVRQTVGKKALTERLKAVRSMKPAIDSRVDEEREDVLRVRQVRYTTDVKLPFCPACQHK